MTVGQRAFWLAVRDCLIIVHGIGSQEAGMLVQEFSDLIAGNATNIYEQEPFWVACSLRQTDVDIRDWLPHYISILQANGLPR